LEKMPYHEGGSVKQFDNTKLLELSLNSEHPPLTVAIASRYLPVCNSMSQLALPSTEAAPPSDESQLALPAPAAAGPSSPTEPQSSPGDAKPSFDESGGRRRRGGDRHGHGGLNLDARIALDVVNAELQQSGGGIVSAVALVSEASPYAEATMALFKPWYSVKQTFQNKVGIGNKDYNAGLRTVALFDRAGTCVAGAVLKRHDSKDTSFIEVQYLVVDPSVAAEDRNIHRRALLLCALKVAVTHGIEKLVVHAMRQGANSMRWITGIGFEEMPRHEVNATTLGETFGNTSPCFLGTGQGRDRTSNLPKALCGILPDLVLFHQRKENFLAEAGAGGAQGPAKRHKLKK
jgi:hypothetical protein